MPLTIEFLSPDNTQGYVFIDRDNITFQFRPKSDSDMDQVKAITKRTKMDEILCHYAGKLFLSEIKSDMDFAADDVRHQATDHISAFDKEKYHLHLKFKRDVDWDIIRQLFEPIPPQALLPCMKSEYKNHILATAYGYFAELNNEKQVKQIEEFHREEKKEELAKLQNQVEGQASTFVKTTPNYDVIKARLAEIEKYYRNTKIKGSPAEKELREYEQDQRTKALETFNQFLNATSSIADFHTVTNENERSSTKASSARHYFLKNPLISSALNKDHNETMGTYLKTMAPIFHALLPFLNTLPADSLVVRNQASNIIGIASTSTPQFFKPITKRNSSDKEKIGNHTLQIKSDSDGEIKTPSCSMTM